MVLYVKCQQLPHSRVSLLGSHEMSTREVIFDSSEDKSGLVMGRGFFASSTIGIHTTGNAYYEFGFRGADKAHEAYSFIIPHLR